MRLIAAKIVFATSAALLGGAGIAYALHGSADPRSDLAGTAVLRSTKPALSTGSGAITKPIVLVGAQMFRSAPLSSSVPNPSRPAAESLAAETPTPTVRSLPTRVVIPSLGLDAPIIPVGLEPDKTMEIPGAAEAGWYKHGALPGEEEGSAVLAGHVDHAGAPGVFLELRTLNLGSQVLVTNDRGITYSYIVSERFQVDKRDLPIAELFRTDGPPTLTLITCGGKFRKSSRSYSDNIVVRAQLSRPTFGAEH